MPKSASPGLQASVHMQRSEGNSSIEDQKPKLVDGGTKNDSHAIHVEHSPRRTLSSSTLAGSDDALDAFADEEEGHELQELIQNEDKESDLSNQEEGHQKRRRRQISWTEHEERIIMRKLDRRLVMFLALLYLLSFLDRSRQDIGNALIAGLPESLSLKDSQTSWILTSFYITYILFEWMTLCYRIFRSSTYIPLCVFFWGLIASLQSLVPNYPTLIVLRLLLGITEAAFGPGVPFYLSQFFRPDELAYRVGIFISAAPLANSFASSLAWGIVLLSQKSRIITPWRALFLIEGFPSLFVALWAWYIIPDSPSTTFFLTPRERHIATLRLPKASHKRSISFRELMITLCSFTPWLTALMFLFTNICFSSLPIFMPTILENSLGFSALSSQILAAPPYLLSFVLLLPITRLSDLLRMRAVPIMLLGLLASASYLGIAILAYISPASYLSIVFRYVLIFPVAVGLFSVVTLIITWTLNNQSSETGKGTGMAVLNLVGQCGPLIGVRAFPKSDEPGYVKGMGICALAMLAVVVFAASLGIVLKKRNEAMDRLKGSSEAQGRSKGQEREWRYII
ncbi:MAG: hypothetical protein Q9160_003104 [Pyrenula sp. 1 TL-2023]